MHFFFAFPEQCFPIDKLHVCAQMHTSFFYALHVHHEHQTEKKNRRNCIPFKDEYLLCCLTCQLSNQNTFITVSIQIFSSSTCS